MTLQACRQNNEIPTGDSCDVLKDNLIIKDLQILQGSVRCDGAIEAAEPATSRRESSGESCQMDLFLF